MILTTRQKYEVIGSGGCDLATFLENAIVTDTGSFSQVVESVGYRPVATTVPTKTGTWHFYSRARYAAPSFLPDGKAPESSVVAVHVPLHTKRNSVGGGYLFMTKPGEHPDIGEICNNTRVIYSGVLENRIINFYEKVAGNDLKIATLFVGGTFGGFILGSSIGLVLGASNESSIGYTLGGTLGLPILSVLGGYALFHIDSHMRGKKLQNVDNYLYGPDAEEALLDDLHQHRLVSVAELAYADLVKNGSNMDRADFWAFYKGLEESGFSIARNNAPHLDEKWFKALSAIQSHLPLLYPAQA